MDAGRPSVETPGCPGCAERDRRIAQLEARVEQLERIIDEIRRGGKRQAAPFSKGPPRTNPGKAGRKPGGDYGKKARRAVPTAIDEVHDAPLPGRCPCCGDRRLDLERVDHQYQTEIPTRPSARLLGAGYAGTLVHDGWAPYDRFGHASHQTCLAHLLRRCHEMLETATRGAVVFPRKVKAVLTEALAIRDRRDAGLLTPRAAQRHADRLEAQVVALTRRAKTNPANERLAAFLYRHQHHLFTFLRRAGIEATNWRAEQALRPAVVNRKVWGGNRTDAGAEAQSVLMTVWHTARLRQVHPAPWLADFLRSPHDTPSLLALPDR